MKKQKKKENLLCRIFGHKADLVDRALSDIKQIAENRNELDPRVICRRCSREFIPKSLTDLNKFKKNE